MQPTSNQLNDQAVSINQSEEIELGILVRVLGQRWRLVSLTASLGLLVGVGVAISRKPSYQASALVQVNDQVSSSSILSALNPFNSKVAQASPAQVQQVLLKSRFILEPVISQLGLDYKIQRTTWWSRLGWGKSVDVGSDQVALADWSLPHAMLNQPFKLRVDGEKQYTLFGQNRQRVLSGVVGQVAVSHQYPDVGLLLSALHAPIGTVYIIQKNDMPAMIQSFLKHISVQEAGGVKGGTGILNVSLTWPNVQQISGILNTLLHVWVEKNTEQKSINAGQSLGFVEKQIPRILASLHQAEQSLNSYRAKKGILDVTVEAKMLLEAIAVQEALLQQSQLKKATLLHSFSVHHPVVQDLTAQIHTLQQRIEQLNKSLHHAPQVDQNVVSLMRDVKAKEQIYTALLSKVEELKLIKAGTIGDVQVLNESTVPINSEPMHRGLAVMLGVVLGSMAGAFFVLLQYMRMRSLNTDPESLERYFGVPVSAILPFSSEQKVISGSVEKSSFIVSHAYPKAVISEAFRSFRTNLVLKYLRPDQQVVAVMGASPGLGKSFCAINIASVLSEIDRSVLLIDCDLRKGRLHKQLGLSAGSGLSGYLSGDVAKPEIREVTENLHFLSAGPHHLRPAEVLSGARLKVMMDDLRQQYDVIILDTPPILAVTDALLLAQFSTFNFMVVSAGQSHVNDLKRAADQLKQSDVMFHGFIYNYTNKKAQIAAASSYGYYQYDYS